jgi:hypothetical protein
VRKRYSFDASKVLDILFNGQSLKNRIILGAVTYELSDFLELGSEVHALYGDLTSGRLFLSH